MSWNDSRQKAQSKVLFVLCDWAPLREIVPPRDQS